MKHEEAVALRIPRKEVILRIQQLHTITAAKANEVYEYRKGKGTMASLIEDLDADAEEKGLPQRLIPKEEPTAAATSLLAAASAMAAASVPQPESEPTNFTPVQGYVEIEILEQVMWMIAMRRGNGRKTASGCAICGDLRQVSGCPCRLGWEALAAAGRDMGDRS